MYNTHVICRLSVYQPYSSNGKEWQSTIMVCSYAFMYASICIFIFLDFSCVHLGKSFVFIEAECQFFCNIKFVSLVCACNLFCSTGAWTVLITAVESSVLLSSQRKIIRLWKSSLNLWGRENWLLSTKNQMDNDSYQTPCNEVRCNPVQPSSSNFCT